MILLRRIMVKVETCFGFSILNTSDLKIPIAHNLVQKQV